LKEVIILAGLTAEVIKKWTIIKDTDNLVGLADACS
jgi:hypothetical protein